MDEKRRKQASFPERKCARCGNIFTPASGSQKFCKDCRTARSNERSVEFRARAKERNKENPCCICGGKFGEMIHGKPYCHKHRSRFRKYGSFDIPKRPPTSNIEFEGDCLKITTTKGEVILADRSDYDLIKNFSWFVSSTGYATTGSGKTQVYMHRLVMREYLTDGKEIDHANGNGLDNRKNNLRVCNHRENLRNLAVQKNNTSGYPGVYKDRYGNYKVMIMVDYKSIVVGTYQTFEQAVAARKRAEDDYHGEFAGHIRREMKNN